MIIYSKTSIALKLTSMSTHISTSGDFFFLSLIKMPFRSAQQSSVGNGLLVSLILLAF